MNFKILEAPLLLLYFSRSRMPALLTVDWLFDWRIFALSAMHTWFARSPNLSVSDNPLRRDEVHDDPDSGGNNEGHFKWHLEH